MIDSKLAFVIQDDEEPASSVPAAAGQVQKVDDPNDLQIEMMEQERLIIQLKEMIRERDKNLTDKDNELKVTSLFIYYGNLFSTIQIIRGTLYARDNNRQ